MILKKSLIVFCSVGALSMLAIAGCSSTPAGTDGGGGGDAADTDSGKVDSGKDSGPKPDSGPGPAMCPEPADVTNFMPGVPTPVKPAAKVCAANDYMDYYTACYAMGATQTTCQNWQMAHQSCYDCMVSQDSDAQWGLVVEGGGVASINVAGCLELVGDHNCAVAYSNVKQCQDAGCKVQCPVTDNASFTLYQQCITKVNAGGCKKYVDASNLACTADAAPNVGKCTGSGGFQGLLTKLGPVFCGP